MGGREDGRTRKEGRKEEGKKSDFLPIIGAERNGHIVRLNPW
jgi:hypothetical protein